MSEIYLPEGSKFEGMTIAETQLRDQDINVLTLYRDAKVIPNPRDSRVLEANDKLLCFGKLESMRGMIPEKTRRRRRPIVADLPPEIPTDALSDDSEEADDQ
ncbi:TrkA C-terminal domain-containing protein [uncultured Amphritea sp.]|uniref:cation:proton antiporter regulatory subunit n=1 Tax=uncultured Amphritea sp. TaxID=981605 RepID=UPI0025E49F82|nr:TrkA C-terminal domain-containing protein [uncultured Amphritea sp.]